MSPFVARAFVAAVLVSLACAVPARAVSVVIQPSSQDAFITKDKPNRIAGAGPNNTRIRVQASPPNTQVRRGLVQFDLSGIPTAATVTAATVELYAGNNAGVALTHGMHQISDAWLQSVVKWNNQPGHAAVATSTASVGGGTGFKSFDVTADVQGFLNVCTSNHGWMVKDQAETATSKDVNYIAREEDHIPDLPNRPRLTVTYTPPPCSIDADCADTNACTVNEHCVAGACVTDALVCSDGDPCTDDICDCTTGCVFSPICNDGFTCTSDTCDPETLECTNTPVESVCNTDCATGTCVADPDSTVIDPVTGCLVATTQPNGTPCNDGDVCTLGDQCVAGFCAAGSAFNCGDNVVQASCGEECDGGPDCDAQCRFICGPTPEAGCKLPAVSGKSVLVIKDNDPDKKNIVVFKWVKGTPTTTADFGTPLADTDYTLCVYDSSANAQPVMRAEAPAGGMCGEKACWKTTKNGGFKYNDKELSPDGLLGVILKPGIVEKAKIVVKGKGVGLALPPLPLTGPVTVQLKNGDACWQASYTSPKKSTPTQFTSKSN